MDVAQLQTIIDRAWEDRASVGLDTKGDVRAAVMHTLSLLDAGKLRVAEKIEGETGPASWHVHQWLKKAVLLSFRLNDMTHDPRRPRRNELVGQGPLEVRELELRRVPHRRVPGRAALRRTPLRLHRPWRRARCPASSISALMSVRARWSTPGRPSAPARRSAGTSTCPAASASAACSSRCRETRRSSRTTAS